MHSIYGLIPKNNNCTAVPSLEQEKTNKQRYLELLNDEPMRDSSPKQSLVASFLSIFFLGGGGGGGKTLKIMYRQKDLRIIYARTRAPQIHVYFQVSKYFLHLHT